MKTVRFTYRNGEYKCSEPGDQDGEYVRAEIARDLLAACERSLNWIDADEVAGRISHTAANLRREAVRAAIAKAKGT